MIVNLIHEKVFPLFEVFKVTSLKVKRQWYKASGILEAVEDIYVEDWPNEVIDVVSVVISPLEQLSLKLLLFLES